MENPPKKDIITKCSVREMAKHFFKDHLVVWYGTALNPEEFVAAPLLNICELQSFPESGAGAAFLRETNKKCYVIIAAEEILVRDLQAIENIQDIYILSNADCPWARNYQKISAVEALIENIFDKIEQKVLSWFKQTSSLKLNLPKFALVASCSQAKLHRFLKIIPANFQNREQALNDFTLLSREIFFSDKKASAEFEQNYYEGYCKENILKAYVGESFVSKITDGCLKLNPNSDSMQYSRLPLRDLERAIQEQYKAKSKEFSGLLYKSASISTEQWSILKESVGQEIEMHGFLSASKLKNVALRSLGLDSKRSVFVTILVPKGPNEEEQGFAEVEEFSGSPQEKEVLFNLRSRFTVLEVEELLCRHVILLYGAQGFRKYISEEATLQEVEIPGEENISCANCKTADATGKVLFVDLDNRDGYYCVKCLPSLAASSFLCTPNTNEKRTIKVKGFTTTFQKGIPFYGYKCSKCHVKRQRFYLTCTDCQQLNLRWCENCFGNSPPDCFKQNHAVIFETSPFSFWSQPMSKKEINMKSKPQPSGVFVQAEIYRENREYEKAIADYKLYIDQNSESPDEKLAQCYNNLGEIYYEKKSHKEGLEVLSKALNIRLSLHGKENHPDVAHSYRNIARIYMKQEEFNLALENYSKALDIRRLLYGEDHKDVASSCQNVGDVYSKQAEYKRSRPEAAKSDQKLIPATKDEFNQALQYLFKSADIRKSLSEQEDLVESYISIGDAYFGQEQYKEALEFFMKALETSISIYGENHPVVADCYGNLARVHCEQKDYKARLEYDIKCLNIRKLFLEENHPDVAQAFQRVGQAFLDLRGEEKKAIEYVSKALEIRKLLYGENHTDVGASYNSLGNALHQKGDYAESQAYLVKALNIRKLLYGEDHKEVGASYFNIAIVASNQKNYREAREYYLKALENKRKHYGENHAMIAGYYDKLGRTCLLEQNYQAALEYYLKALDIRKMLHKDHQQIDFVRSYNSLGTIYINLRDFNQALTYLLEALDIQRAVSGENHEDSIPIYSNIALVYENQRDFKTALEYHENSLRIRRILYGETHREICLSYSDLGIMYEKQGDKLKALEYCQKELAMRKIVDGECNHRTQRVQKKVDRLIQSTAGSQSFRTQFGQ